MPLNIFFRRDKDYKIIPVSGVWGGLTAAGLLNCELFVEGREAPEKIVVDDTGKEISRNPAQQQIVREILISLVMRPEVARSIGQWLISKADEYDKMLAPKKIT
ncbi:MAG: hypothetical protein Q8M71_05740 [Thermodesulfovibrionales bacterium]|nr:hypothetical protein [Thermodesulfovibrionales bacterium]